MEQTQQTRRRSARVSLGFSDNAVSVSVDDQDLSRPWREVAREVLSESTNPDECRLREVLESPGDFQFVRGRTYLSADSTAGEVLGTGGNQESSEDQEQDAESLVRVMRKQRGGGLP
jgi:hypothetical protein